MQDTANATPYPARRGSSVVPNGAIQLRLEALGRGRSPACVDFDGATAQPAATQRQLLAQVEAACALHPPPPPDPDYRIAELVPDMPNTVRIAVYELLLASGRWQERHQNTSMRVIRAVIAAGQLAQTYPTDAAAYNCLDVSSSAFAAWKRHLLAIRGGPLIPPPPLALAPPTETEPATPQPPSPEPAAEAPSFDPDHATDGPDENTATVGQAYADFVLAVALSRPESVATELARQLAALLGRGVLNRTGARMMASAARHLLDPSVDHGTDATLLDALNHWVQVLSPLHAAFRAAQPPDSAWAIDGGSYSGTPASNPLPPTPPAAPSTAEPAPEDILPSPPSRPPLPSTAIPPPPPDDTCPSPHDAPPDAASPAPAPDHAELCDVCAEPLLASAKGLARGVDAWGHAPCCSCRMHRLCLHRWLNGGPSGQRQFVVHYDELNSEMCSTQRTCPGCRRPISLRDLQPAESRPDAPPNAGAADGPSVTSHPCGPSAAATPAETTPLAANAADTAEHAVPAAAVAAAASTDAALGATAHVATGANPGLLRRRSAEQRQRRQRQRDDAATVVVLDAVAVDSPPAAEGPPLPPHAAPIYPPPPPVVPSAPPPADGGLGSTTLGSGNLNMNGNEPIAHEVACTRDTDYGNCFVGAHHPALDAKERDGVCDAFDEAARLLAAGQTLRPPELGAIALRHDVRLHHSTPSGYGGRLFRAMRPLIGTNPRFRCSASCAGRRCHKASLLRWCRDEFRAEGRLAAPPSSSTPAPRPTRIAWSGGAISSNRDEAVTAFIARKRSMGTLALDEEARLLASLEHKAPAVVKSTSEAPPPSPAAAAPLPAPCAPLRAVPDPGVVAAAPRDVPQGTPIAPRPPRARPARVRNACPAPLNAHRSRAPYVAPTNAARPPAFHCVRQ